MKKNDVKTVCLFCGKGKDDSPIVKVRDMKHIPQRVVVDYEPCDECKKEWEKGVPIIEVTTEPAIKGQPPLTSTEGYAMYPTGRYMVLNKEAMDENYKVGVPTLCLKMDYDTILNNFKRYTFGRKDNAQTDK